ncbi:MAG: hypothetical protein QNK82_15155 [Akkermansiaceae bacterium]
MTLELFASQISEAASSTKLQSLTIVGGPRELRLLANFLAQSADEIDAHGPHVSHREFCNEPGVKEYEGSLPDVSVSQCV